MLVRAFETALREVGVTRGEGPSVLVACSGGIDSMALLRVAWLVLGPKRVSVGHVNHGLRADSMEEANFVRSVGLELGVQVEVATLQPATFDEATLRGLRYRALETMRQTVKAEWILTGHHADDQAETVLLHLFRAKSTSSIPQRNGKVLRPLLKVSKKVLRAYLEAKRWSHREDETNREPAYLRNRVRKELLPLLERRYAPNIRERLATFGTGVALISPNPRFGAAPEAASQQRSTPAVRCVQRLLETGTRPPRSAREVWFDADAVAEVSIRPWIEGDRIAPFGRFEGRRLVSDILSEARVPLPERPTYPLLVDSRGEVLWVVGLQRSQHAPVVPDTKRIWVFSVDKGDEGSET